MQNIPVLFILTLQVLALLPSECRLILCVLDSECVKWILSSSAKDYGIVPFDISLQVLLLLPKAFIDDIF